MTHVPLNTLNRVGAGRLLGQGGFTVTKLSGAPLTTSGGRPTLLTFALAWCPHCAADSWALAIALSRFGKLSGLPWNLVPYRVPLSILRRPDFPHTQGLSFVSARYTSAT